MKSNNGQGYQPKTGQKCSCKRGIQRDNCQSCEGTGYVIDFKKIRETIIEIEALKADHQKELDSKLKTLQLKERFAELTGLDFMVCDHGNYCSVYIENSRFDQTPKFDRFKISEYYKAIAEAFTPRNVVLSFASKDSIVTESNCKIEFDNNTSEIVWAHPQTAKIEFWFEGINLSFKFPYSRHNRTFENEVIGYVNFDLDENKRNKGEHRVKACYYISGLPKVHYYGHHFVTYATNEDEKKEIFNLAFNGKFLASE